MEDTGREYDRQCNEGWPKGMIGKPRRIIRELYKEICSHFSKPSDVGVRFDVEKMAIYLYQSEWGENIPWEKVATLQQRMYRKRVSLLNANLLSLIDSKAGK